MNINEEQLELTKKLFDQNGLVTFGGLFGIDIVDKLDLCISKIMAGDYVTGIPPKKRNVPPSKRGSPLCRTEYPQTSDPSILELIRQTEIGALVARILDVSCVQAWFIQTIYKNYTDSSEGVIGWHQDGQYTTKLFHGDFITASISFSDVMDDSGPVRYVIGSHKGPLFEQRHGSGFSHIGDLALLRGRIEKNFEILWKEFTPLPQRGDLTLHHSRLIHGSAPCRNHASRKTLVVHLRTEKNPFIVTQVNRQTDTGSYDISFKDPLLCPCIYHKAAD